MADPPAAQPAGATNGESDLALDVDALGAQMSGHLIELVEAWTDQMRALAEAGIDPAPLVRALARTLRATADQLDPAAGAPAPEAPPESPAASDTGSTALSAPAGPTGAGANTIASVTRPPA